MIRLIVLTLLCGLVACEANRDHHEHDHESHTHEHDHEHDHDESGVVEIAETHGIRVVPAEPGEVRETVALLGKVVLSPERVSHVEARYPGLVRKVEASIGEHIKAGQILATVESNESLREYTVPAPINGVVIDRHANTGEFTGSRVLFTLADYSSLVLELPVFPQEAARIRVGQPVLLQSHGRSAAAVISSLTPQETGAPVVVARAELDNGEGRWAAGEMLNALVEIGRTPVAVRIENSAIQPIKGRTSIFVEVGQGEHQGERLFEARAIVLGRTDSQFSEVLEGLHPGELYVAENSYVLKAELEKSSAAHEH